MNATARRVVHVIAEFSPHEAMGRTVVETASRLPGEHVVITTRAHSAHHLHELFAEVVELGGSVASFPLGRQDALTAALDRLDPDVVHLHGGGLTPWWAALPPLRHRPKAVTMYAWPTLPPWRQVRGSSWGEMVRSNVLQPRVLATSVLPAAAARAMLRASGTRAVLTPDPRAERRLRPSRRARRSGGVQRLRTGATGDPRRAAWQDTAPTIVFAGRAETVRGLDTLLDAFPEVLRAVPDARLRLLLLPRPELPAILGRVRDAAVAEHVEVVTEPIADLGAELAAARVGVWPFKFDYTTSPPAMALVEGLSVGLPVVGTDVACVRSVLDDERGGLVVPPSDPAALAAALVRLLTDRALWEDQARAALDVAATCDWAAATRVTDEAYAAVART